MTIRTYDEQKAHEREERRLWVQSLADTYGTVIASAKAVGTTVYTVRHLAALHCVTFKESPRGPRKLAEQDVQRVVMRSPNQRVAARKLGVSQAAVSKYLAKVGANG
jgi:hypothetical protein